MKNEGWPDIKSELTATIDKLKAEAVDSWVKSCKEKGLEIEYSCEFHYLDQERPIRPGGLYCNDGRWSLTPILETSYSPKPGVRVYAFQVG